jgi:hypothetical protein
MYTLTDKLQFQAWAIKQGKHKPAIVHLELMDWMTKQFDVHALDFFCEIRDTSKGISQQLIHMILETAEDVKQMQANHANNTMITERFLKYLKSADSNNHKSDPLKGNVFPVETNPFPKIIVTYRPMKEIDSKILNEMLEDEQRAILKTFESVWTMSMAVVFYYTDAQVKENLTNGTSAKITEALEQASEKFGYDQGSLYRFDSKETFDRDYESNWYYYWK